MLGKSAGNEPRRFLPEIAYANASSVRVETAANPSRSPVLISNPWEGGRQPFLPGPVKYQAGKIATMEIIPVRPALWS